jgi:hypothetical protein
MRRDRSFGGRVRYDAAFIEEQEEGDEDVTDIIGDVDDKEET